jgi:hypothetical protein
MCTGDLRLPIAATVALKDAIAVLTGFERNTEGGKLIITTAGLPDCAASPTDQADCASRNSPDGNKVNSYECRATPPRSSGCTSYRRTRRVLNIVRTGSHKYPAAVGAVGVRLQHQCLRNVSTVWPLVCPGRLGVTTACPPQLPSAAG